MKKSKFQFLNPYLVKLNFAVNSEFISEDDPNIKIENSFSINVDRKEDEKKASVILTLNVNKENAKAPFMIEISVASDFKWADDVEDDAADKMLHVNAPALLLGHMRPIVANITNSAGYPAYNVPFINFTE